MSIRVLCYGLGPIGLNIARLAAQRPGLQIVGALDIDPAKVGRDLGELLGGGPLNVVVTDNVADAVAGKPQVVLHATSSSLARVTAQLEELAGLGINVVSTCEELSYPWATQPQIATLLDRAAKAGGVTLLGTGINPGYAMDALPLMLTAPCASVTKVSVTRVVDAARRRGPLQKKVGAGLTPEAFQEQVRLGNVRHVGLPESLAMVAGSLGWQLDSVEDTIEPVIAEAAIITEHVRVEVGQVAGVRQVASGLQGGVEVVRLELRMYLGAPDPRDEIQIEGDPNIHTMVPGGFPGDIATAAIIVNAAPAVLRAAPGLATMVDIGVVHWSA
jgi:4-hydroxy-tetrahydrodipicolinate reductase